MGWNPRHTIRWSSPTFGVRCDKGVSGCLPFPGAPRTVRTKLLLLQPSAPACISSVYAWPRGPESLAWPVEDRAGHGGAHGRAWVRARAHPRPWQLNRLLNLADTSSTHRSKYMTESAYLSRLIPSNHPPHSICRAQKVGTLPQSSCNIHVFSLSAN